MPVSTSYGPLSGFLTFQPDIKETLEELRRVWNAMLNQDLVTLESGGVLKTMY